MKSTRKMALAAIQNLVLPDGWDAYTPHLRFSGFRHRWEKDKITGQMHLSALGTMPGYIEIRCQSMTIITDIENLDRAVKHCMAWIDGD